MDYLFSKLDNKEKFNFLDNIFNAVFDGIVLINPFGEVIYANRLSEDLLSMKRTEMIDKSFDEVCRQKELVKELLKKTGKSSTNFRLNNKHITLKSNSFISNGKLIATIIIIRNVTEEKDSENQLKEMKNSLETMEDILDNAYQGIVLVDREGRIVKFNYEKLMGIKEEDVLGKPVEDVIDNTRIHIVAKTGIKELCQVQRIQGHDMIASRTPIVKNGEVIGAVGTVLFKDVKELKSLVQKLLQLEKKFDSYKDEIQRMQEAKYSFENIITNNKKMEHLKEIAQRAAESNSTILIDGESGTGKELFAHAIHKASHRKYGAFISINCAAIPRELLEAELFGYEEGAFTGAKREGKPGKFELANGGTILLDEIGSMPMEMQAKLLRVLEERAFERIGGTMKIDLDIRIISSTNENLEDAVKRGKFRQDLYYRLNVIRINILPLRERKDDIELLSRYILDDLVVKLDMEKKDLADDTIKVLKKHSWPGNVRELRNIIERSLNIASGNTIYPKDLPEYLIDEEIEAILENEEETVLLKKIVADAEIDAIKRALKQSAGNKTLAAKKLGIHRTALYKKMDMYRIEV
nr:sigma 54-interacting transcriptional regulator [Clostridiisalibacter paucivorans]